MCRLLADPQHSAEVEGVARRIAGDSASLDPLGVGAKGGRSPFDVVRVVLPEFSLGSIAPVAVAARVCDPSVR